MSLVVGTNNGNHNRVMLLSIPIFFLSILLHQSNVMFGVNLSFADFFCMFILLVLVINNQLYIPITPLLFFIIVSSVVIITAVFYVPLVFMIEPNPRSVISDYIKLLAIFVYFIVGYNLSQLNLLDRTLKWYSVFGMFIGLIGIIFTFLNIRVFSDLLFFGENRFKGLMIDPNYFSILQISAFVYISRLKKIKLRYKYLTAIITFFSVLTSGSKTGIITLICYFTLRVLEYLFSREKKLNIWVTQLFFLALLMIVIPYTFHYLQAVLNNIASSIPSFSRIHLLITDFNEAISENGSGREATWMAALQIIQLSPITGIGIGTYMNVAGEIFQHGNLAHNTFLQLSAEWGIPIAFSFFFYVVYTLGRATNSQIGHLETNLILRDIILVLLIGSMAISLNNARVLWLFLGALVFSLKRSNKKENSYKLP